MEPPNELVVEKALTRAAVQKQESSVVPGLLPFSYSQLHPLVIIHSKWSENVPGFSGKVSLCSAVRGERSGERFLGSRTRWEGVDQGSLMGSKAFSAIYCHAMSCLPCDPSRNELRGHFGLNN